MFSQGESLKKEGIKIEYFTIQGKGLIGYLRSVKKMKGVLKKDTYDLVHSHYSLSSFAASLAGAKSQVVSLMGSDVNAGFVFKLLIRLFNSFFWAKCIVKSEDMKKKVGIPDANVIPNGVDMDRFRPLSETDCREKLGWEKRKKHILFPADPDRREKNSALAEKSIEMLRADFEIELHYLTGIDHAETPHFFNAADLVLMTSLWEGSPNVIKEAMACNCPIVSTDVGDVRWVIGDTTGCFFTSFDYREIVEKIQASLKFAERRGKTSGRERIMELDLDAGSVAEKIIGVYKKVIE